MIISVSNYKCWIDSYIMSIIVILGLGLLASLHVDSASIAKKSEGSFLLANGTCNLPKSLIEEIRGYQPIVDRIIDYSINGGFAGQTWER